MSYQIDLSEIDRAHSRIEQAKEYLDIVVDVLQWKTTLGLEEMLMLDDERYKFQMKYLGLSKEDYIKYLAIWGKASELDRQFSYLSRDGRIYDINNGDYMDKKTAYERYCGGYEVGTKIRDRIAEAKEQSTLHERDIMNKCPEYNNDLAAMLGVNREDYVAKANRIREDTRALRERMFPPHEDKGDQGIGEQPGPRRL